MKLVQIGTVGHYGYALTGAKKIPCDMAGICAPNPCDNPENAKKKWEALGSSPRIYDDPIAMMEEVCPDIAVINTVMADNARYAMEALKRGISVFLEKPMATTPEDLEQLEKVYKSSRAIYAPEKNVCLTAMFGIDYNPAFETAYRYVKSGALGDIVLANGQKSYRMGNRAKYYSDRQRYGGTIPWVAIHAIEWVTRIGRLRPVTATAYGSTAHNAGNGTMEAATLTLFECEGGKMASVSADVLRPAAAPSHGDDRIRLVGSEGILEVRGGQVIVIDKEGEKILTQVQTETELFEELILEIRGEGRCRVRPEDGFLATRAALAARESEDTGRSVTIK